MDFSYVDIIFNKTIESNTDGGIPIKSKIRIEIKMSINKSNSFIFIISSTILYFTSKVKYH